MLLLSSSLDEPVMDAQDSYYHTPKKLLCADSLVIGRSTLILSGCDEVTQRAVDITSILSGVGPAYPEQLL